jgi:indoleamine 2,3-dioxygenase
MQDAHPGNLKIHCAFTSTQDEEHFYRIQVLIEHCGVVAMRLMSRVIEEVSTPSQSTVSSVTALLKELVAVVDDINRHLNQVRNGCDPSVFYNEVRHWFPGAKLIFEGTQLGCKEEVEEWAGSSAAQSTTIQALDAFLGIDELTHNPDVELEMQKDGKMVSFLTRMRMYIPADHRVVLDNLSVFGRSLRAFIIANSSPQSPSPALVAYNSVITSLKNFRTSHIRVATIYIVNQRKGAKSIGTGGTELVPFLRSVRDQTGQGMV